VKRTRLVSVSDAIDGIVFAVRNQPNIRIHLVAAVLTLVLSIVLGVTEVEFMIVSLVIGLVIAAELFNSAIEGAVDLITDHYHPLAKMVKDTAAGAVLVTSVIAVIAGYLVFYKRLAGSVVEGIVIVKRAPATITMVALVLTVIVVIAAKARFGRGTPLAGGMPSGHAALSFAAFTAVALTSEDALITFLAFLLAVMVSHSRLIYRIHSLGEVVAGGLLGAILTLLLFQVFAS
jgi:diacylglycerol kinase (ATP)